MARVRKRSERKASDDIAPKRHPSNGPRDLARKSGETMYTHQLAERIIGFIRAGGYVTQAAGAAGISPQTFYNWLRRGARGEEPFTFLVEGVEKAKDEAELRFVAIIAKAAETQWQAAAWWLERTRPRRFGRRDALDVSVESDTPIEVDARRVDLSKLSIEDLRELRRLREKARIAREDDPVDGD